MKCMLEGLDYIGRISGCHRRADRSFFYKEYQFPVCARCTGAFIGNVLSIIGLFIYIPYWGILVGGCGIMFVDWYIQYINVVESTNLRRLFTGIIGGYSFTTLHFAVLLYLVKVINNVI